MYPSSLEGIDAVEFPSGEQPKGLLGHSLKGKGGLRQGRSLVLPSSDSLDLPHYNAMMIDRQRYSTIE